MPGLAELAAGWNELRPAGGTTCSRGTPFVFFVRKGRTDRVILEFMGGGACWSVETCGLRQPTFREVIDDLRPLYNTSGAPAASEAGTADALRDAGISDATGDTADWTHVYVPYCTGDLHWGNSTVTYLPGVTVHHRGAVNAQSAVDWMQANLGSPEVVLVTGCSAGAYGSLLWAARIAPYYLARSTRLVQFGDSGAGIVTPSFLADAYPSWNTAAAFPWEIVPPALQGTRSNADFAASNLQLSDFYRFAAAAYPAATWSQYSSAYDENQAFFLLAMLQTDAPRGEPSLADKLEWSARMRAKYSNDTAALLALPNYFQWIGSGDEHCVIPYNRYHWVSSPSGQRLTSWVAAMVAGTASTASSARLVDCGGQCTVGLQTVDLEPDSV